MSTYPITSDHADCSCEQPTCYDCRRQAIDATALYVQQREARYCSGMVGFDVEAHSWRMADQYRYAAINALAMELWHDRTA